MSKKEEKVKNCISCNKALKRINWYYRNGGYFCNKSCFQNHVKKQKEQKSS